MDFIEKLEKRWNNKKFVCIGLDPVLSNLPKHLEGNFFEFNKAIIDETSDTVLAYKPNSAFYEALGYMGIRFLQETVNYILSNHPDIPVILDAKRADIGSTNHGYVDYAFDYIKADAITVHPYLGREALKPFLERKDKGVIVLTKTSNPGAGEFQDVVVEGKELYIRVAEAISTSWNENGNCALVVGATYPKDLLKVREIVGDMPILIPGIGAQGGDLENTVKSGLTKDKKGIIISSSRSIIFASNDEDFAEAARVETEKLHNEIQKYI